MWTELVQGAGWGRQETSEAALHQNRKGRSKNSAGCCEHLGWLRVLIAREHGSTVSRFVLKFNCWSN